MRRRLNHIRAYPLFHSPSPSSFIALDCLTPHHSDPIDRFARWLASIDNYTGTDFDYLNREGVIPLSAIRKKGERRNDAFAEPAEEDVESGKGGRKGMEEMEG